jgi:hypothetical protein
MALKMRVNTSKVNTTCLLLYHPIKLSVAWTSFTKEEMEQLKEEAREKGK